MLEVYRKVRIRGLHRKWLSDVMPPALPTENWRFRELVAESRTDRQRTTIYSKSVFEEGWSRFVLINHAKFPQSHGCSCREGGLRFAEWEQLQSVSSYFLGRNIEWET